MERRFPRPRGRFARLAWTALPVVAVLTAGAVAGRGAHAEDSAADKAEAKERCAVRLSIALVGKSAEAAQVSAADPQGSVDAMLASPEFADRWARFINAAFNGGPVSDAKDDPVYYLAKHIVTNNKPWRDMFVGPYDVKPSATAMDVADDPEGLGYFRTDSWMRRYAGNEAAGMMLVGAFRIIQNTTGIELVPSVGNPGDDRTESGRSASACKSCHFDAWYALDKFARLLPTRVGMGAEMKFTAPTAGPQQLLGKSIANDKEMVTALVDSDPWRFNQCREVFKFLYGRAENQCEAEVFDKCVDALETTKTIQSAIAAVAKDPTFCK